MSASLSGASFNRLIVDGIEAGKKAMVRYPQPNYVISKFAEESGEVVKAAIHFAEGRETAENLRAEMVQAIGMLYRLWVEGDAVHGMEAVHNALLSGYENDGVPSWLKAKGESE